MGPRAHCAMQDQARQRATAANTTGVFKPAGGVGVRVPPPAPNGVSSFLGACCRSRTYHAQYPRGTTPAFSTSSPRFEEDSRSGWTASVGYLTSMVQPPRTAARLLREWADRPEDEPGELVDGVLEQEETPSFVHEPVVGWLMRLLGN